MSSHAKAHPYKSIGWFVFHCLMFSCISTLTKYLMQQGIPLVQILFFQTFFACILLSLHARKLFLLKITNKIAVISFIRAFCWLLATALFFFSLNYIILPRAMAISFSTPLFTIILAIIILKETIQPYYFIALLIGSIGMLIILRPGFDSFEPASLLVLGACALWSITDIIIKRLGGIHDGSTITWFFSFFSFLILIPILPFIWQDMTITNTLSLLALSVLFILNILSITYSYKISDLTIIQPFAFTSLIFVAILSYIFFDETITVATIVGSLVIITSTSYIAYNEHKKHKKWLAYKIAQEVIPS